MTLRPFVLLLAVAWSTHALAQTAEPVPPAPTAPPSDPAPAPVLTSAGPAGGGQPEILLEQGPNSHVGETTRIALPPAGPDREAVLRGLLKVDLQTNTAFVGGSALSAFDFYDRVGRPDLAATADGQTRKRIWMISGATLLTVAGVVTGAMVINNAQDLNDPACFTGTGAERGHTYNDCVNRNHDTTLIGGLIIVGAVTLGGGLLTWALLTPEMVTTPEQTVGLAAEYNRKLAVQHGAPSGVKLDVLPSIGPGGASLTARLTF